MLFTDLILFGEERQSSFARRFQVVIEAAIETVAVVGRSIVLVNAPDAHHSTAENATTWDSTEEELRNFGVDPGSLQLSLLEQDSMERSFMIVICGRKQRVITMATDAAEEKAEWLSQLRLCGRHE